MGAARLFSKTNIKKLNKESLKKMSRMRLLEMHQAFESCIESDKTESFAKDEMVHPLVQIEWDNS